MVRIMRPSVHCPPREVVEVYDGFVLGNASKERRAVTGPEEPNASSLRPCFSKESMTES